jgi:glycosyltransferase involved in cell wall biosynthesis
VKILLLTYFFPPAGGAGVHRPLKFAAHLPRLGIETHVLAPTDPKWLYLDPELTLPPDATVHRAPYLGPRTRLLAEELYGLRNGARALRTLQLLWPRLLLPDQHALWIATAGPSALAIARRERVDVVLTTSPPSSVHLVGAMVKAATGARWVADLRDPLLEHPHRRLERRLVQAKEHAETLVARLVSTHADAIVGASEQTAAQMEGLHPRGRVATIGNGCDFEDFDGLEYHPAPRFRITHVGLIIGKRDPRPFLTAVTRSGLDITARFVGGFRSADREWAHQVGIGQRLEVHPYVSHRRALALERDSEALLLLIPDAEGRGRGVVTAKVFEYVAAGRPILAAVPPNGEAAALLRATGRALIVPPDDVHRLCEALVSLKAQWRRGELDPQPRPSHLSEQLSRRARASELAELLRALS